MAPKVVSSNLTIYPLFFLLFNKYSNFTINFNKLILTNIDNFITNLNFLIRYFLLNELIWQEGFLVDFLQKKLIDNWIKKFLICASYLFNERFIFDNLIRFFLNLIIWPLHKISIFNFNNVSNLFFIFIFFFIFFYFIFYFLFVFFLMF